MTDKKITRGQAIERIIDLMIKGHSIPMCSIENSSIEFSFIDSEDINLAIFLNSLHNANKFDVVPMEEIAEDFEFNGIHSENFDVCVEFEDNSEENTYKEQYLLWGLD